MEKKMKKQQDKGEFCKHDKQVEKVRSGLDKGGKEDVNKGKWKGSK